MSSTSHDPQASQAPRNLPAPVFDDQERQNVEYLTGMMGSNADSDIEAARRVLRKYNGDVQKAATALLEGEGAETVPSAAPEYSTSLSYANTDYDKQYLKPPPGTPTGAQSTPVVIDLTSEDHDLRQALQMSMEQSNETKFGPSERPADGSWAMVPSTMATDSGQTNATSGMSMEDRTLNQAIEASFNDFRTNDEEPIPKDGRAIRRDHRPVVLRSTSPFIAYATLLLQGLYYVPQIRESLASLELIDPEVGLLAEDADMWNLIETFAHMDKGILIVLAGDDILQGRLDAKPCSSPSDLPGLATSDFLRKTAETIENYVKKQAGDTIGHLPLLNFSYSRIDCAPDSPSNVGQTASTCAVNIDTKSKTGVCDLLGLLEEDMNHFEADKSGHNVILEPSQVIAFNISTSHGVAPQSSPPEMLSYPKSIYLDQFLASNLDFANEKRVLQQALRSKAKVLAEKKQAIAYKDGIDTLKVIGSSLYYYEQVAEAKGDPARESMIKQMAAKLKATMDVIEKQLAELDREILESTRSAASAMDCPELQHHKYELRAVFMHTGIPGRKQIYSYVKDRGTWWKTVDMEVTEVPEETVLTDPTGLHLGAGPYLLIYSRSLENENPELKWPEVISAHMHDNHERFLQTLGPEVAAQLAPFLKDERAERLQAKGIEETPMDVMSQ
ncbi:hypothetical protein HGRIS_012262 [Hohenbuehelia grisea]|uniref:Peptidase C19 ubiquitin carboxyl-terminal hydrolase domain-containing protein n=1 Tax=Hohenbuehelia grisea TaxID=104357 RepID=A0ABR3IRT5_9AGAR